MSEIREKIHNSLYKLAERLSYQLNANTLFNENSDDLSKFFKLPMFFISQGDTKSSHKLLEFIKENFLQDNGDFKSSIKNKSIKGEYSEYWTYLNGWILRAAIRAKYHLPGMANRYFELQNDEERIITGEIDGKNTESDVLTDAHYGMYYLDVNDLNSAQMVFFRIIKQFDVQHDLESGFYLRYDSKGLIDKYSEDKAMFYRVNTKEEQLYFMVAFPCAFLVSYYRKTGNKVALDYAEKYMNFILSCDNCMEKSMFSHKTAWALSLLYAETKEEKYLLTLDKIIDYFIGAQNENGLWFSEQDINTCLDQSAEIGCWFSEIVRNLEMTKEAQIQPDSTGSKITACL